MVENARRERKEGSHFKEREENGRCGEVGKKRMDEKELEYLQFGERVTPLCIWKEFWFT
jgi:hypothetical protein